MGVTKANLSAGFHTQPGASSPVDLEIRFHFGNQNRDETHLVSAADSAAIEAAVKNGDQTAFGVAMDAALPAGYWAAMTPGQRGGYWRDMVRLASWGA